MRVAEFFENHLQILGFKSKYKYISCINSKSPEYGSDFASFAYKNACDGERWPPRVFFGTKRLTNGNFCSYAISATAVAHEFAHKLIYETVMDEHIGENTKQRKGFNYSSPQTGALEESYADIFAILFANRNQPDISQWNWEIGNGFGSDGRALRNVSSPGTYNHPDHMDYINEGSDDFHHCHSNNGIHNKALYYLLILQMKTKNTFLMLAQQSSYFI
jgi:bacillolysin/neutral peptidase B